MNHEDLRRLHGSIVALVLAGTVACDDGARTPPGEWTGTVDTLPSGRIVVSNPDAPQWEPGEEWQLRERFRLGRLDGDGPELFGEIRDVELGSDGGLYVLDAQASEVRVFDADGQYIRTLGRSGQGPGELNRPAGLALDSAGALWIMNWRNARFTAYDPTSGELLREVRRFAGFTSLPWPGRFDHSNRLLDVGVGQADERVILRLDTAFVPQDTLVLPEPDEDDRIFFREEGRISMSIRDPFATEPAWAPDPRGGIVLAEGDAYRIHRIGFDNDTSITIEVQREPMPVTGAERDSVLAAYRRVIEMAAGNAVPDREPRVADHRPPHGKVFVDDSDRVWVERTDGPATSSDWDVVSEDGRFLGRISIPLASVDVVVVRGDRVAVVTSVDDIPTVVVYELVVDDG